MSAAPPPTGASGATPPLETGVQAMDLDPVLMGLQLIPFLVVVFGLHQILWKPLLAMLAEREAGTAGLADASRSLAEENKKLAEELDQRLLQARSQAATERARLRRQTQTEEINIISEAKERVEQLLAEGRGDIAAAQADARGALRTEARQLADALASAVARKSSAAAGMESRA